jgi:hypothetical protein
MKIGLPALVGCALAAASPLTAPAQPPKPGPEMIVIRATPRTTEQVVDAVKSYSEERKWLFMGEMKVKQGAVTMLKVCIPAVGKVLWPAGLQVSALLPCGNLGLYRKGGRTEISMLHPSYMEVLYPTAEVKKAVEVATPLLMDMLDAVAK